MVIDTVLFRYYDDAEREVQLNQVHDCLQIHNRLYI